MAILVTGGAGYIGSVTAARLRENGEEIVVLDDLIRGHRAALEAGVPFYQGPVGDGALLERITREPQDRFRRLRDCNLPSAPWELNLVASDHAKKMPIR